MTLSLNDLQLLTALVGSLHEASPDSVAERPAVARKLESLLGIDVMSHIVRHEANPIPIHTSTWGRDLQLNADYKQYFHAVDPISPLLHRRADPLLVEGIIGRRSLQRTEYFTDFLTRYKVYPGMSLCLDAGGGTLLDYRLGTSEVGRVFGEGELRILDLLRPHLINAHRQGEVCELLLKGLSDKQISKALNISYWTVRSHVGRVLDKLGIESRSAVAACVIAAR